MYLFLAFLLVPIVEIALFIQVGGLIGLWPTIGIVILTAVAGTWLMKVQGRAALAELSRSFSELRDPTAPLAHGAMILLAGALLVTPGFFTDTVGLLLLVPKVREAVMRFVAARVTVARFQMGTRAPGSAPGGDVVEGEYEDVTPHRGRDRGPSGWVNGPERR